MKVAVATWNGRISPVFDVARQVQLLEVQNGRVAHWRQEALPGTEPQTQADCLKALCPQVLICGAISQPMADLLADIGIRVFPFTAGNVDTVIAAWLAGNLPDPELAMPGCCGRRWGCQGGRGRKRMRRGCSIEPVVALSEAETGERPPGKETT